ncbi:MAG: RNA methyltransferase [Prolixibacteraceae bacterium]|jgi:TrmH family RNA methyltransferase|nr:RNA methyltransferase [Prolixibacteraceae bacterium]
MEELSKNRIKYIRQLSQKKFRKKEKRYIAEGAKIIEDLIDGKHPIEMIYASEEAYLQLQAKAKDNNIEIIAISEASIEKVSQLTTASNAIAVIPFKEQFFCIEELNHKIAIALDNIQDPGNLGTIIRIADWFGIDHILCSKDTVDVHNIKVIQATMGAIARVEVHYLDLEEVLPHAHDANIPVYGTFLEGENIYNEKLSSNGIIVMGNEGKGISPKIESLITNKITIPSFRQDKGSESLNVAMATSIICSEFKRR